MARGCRTRLPAEDVWLGLSNCCAVRGRGPQLLNPTPILLSVPLVERLLSGIAMALELLPANGIADTALLPAPLELHALMRRVLELHSH